MLCIEHRQNNSNDVAWGALYKYEVGSPVYEYHDGMSWRKRRGTVARIDPDGSVLINMHT